jgi:hypothetical protein
MSFEMDNVIGKGAQGAPEQFPPEYKSFDECKEKTDLSIRWVQEANGEVSVSLVPRPSVDKRNPDGSVASMSMSPTEMVFTHDEKAKAAAFYDKACETLQAATKAATSREAIWATMDELFSSTENAE